MPLSSVVRCHRSCLTLLSSDVSPLLFRSSPLLNGSPLVAICEYEGEVLVVVSFLLVKEHGS